MTQQSNTVNFLIQDASGEYYKFCLLSVQWGENVDDELHLIFRYLSRISVITSCIALNSVNNDTVV